VTAASVPSLPTVASSAPLSATTAVAGAARPAVRVVATTAPDPRAFAAALAQPAISHTQVPTAASAPPPPAQPEPLNTQLAAPLFAMRSAGSGTHVLTLTVSPESVGPVTVRAHVTDGLMRVELSAPTAQGTDALHAMLPDLKRDLSQGGLNSALSISSPTADGAAAGSQNPFGGAGGFARDDRPSYFRNAPTTPAAPAASSSRPISVGATSALDVLA
jgi:flagellar hook-length control protein FliK